MQSSLRFVCAQKNLSSESMNPINIESDIGYIWSESVLLFDLMTRDGHKEQSVKMKKKNWKREMEIYLRCDDLALVVRAIHLSHWTIFSMACVILFQTLASSLLVWNAIRFSSRNKISLVIFFNWDYAEQWIGMWWHSEKQQTKKKQ